MEMDREAVEMTNVQRTKIRMERVIQKGVVHGKIYGAPSLAGRALLGSRRAFAGRLWLLRWVWEWGSCVRRVVVGSEVETICVCESQPTAHADAGMDRMLQVSQTLDVLNHLPVAANISSHFGCEVPTTINNPSGVQDTGRFVGFPNDIVARYISRLEGQRG